MNQELDPAARSPGEAPHIRHLVVLGDALNDLLPLRNEGPGRLERLFLPQLSGPWKLSVIAPQGLSRRGAALDLPPDATHVMVCLEGSVAIEASGLLKGRPGSFEDALVALSHAADEFELEVERLIGTALSPGLPTVVCTLYPPRYEEPRHQRAVITALAVFNQRILQQAFSARVPVIALSQVCNDALDYADAMRLSKLGMRKVANAMVAALEAAGRGSSRSQVFY